MKPLLEIDELASWYLDGSADRLEDIMRWTYGAALEEIEAAHEQVEHNALLARDIDREAGAA